MKSTMKFHGMTLKVEFVPESRATTELGVCKIEMEAKGSECEDTFEAGEYKECLDAGSKMLSQMKEDLPILIKGVGDAIVDVTLRTKSL